jgi:hypothetical protein
MVHKLASLVLGAAALTTSIYAIPIHRDGALEARYVDTAPIVARAPKARVRQSAAKPAAKHKPAAAKHNHKPAVSPRVKPAAKPKKPVAKPKPAAKPHQFIHKPATRPKPAAKPHGKPVHNNWLQSALGNVGHVAQDVKKVTNQALPVAKDVVHIAEKAAPLIPKLAPVAAKVLPMAEKALPIAAEIAAFLRRDIEERDDFDEDWLLSREFDMVDELD